MLETALRARGALLGELARLGVEVDVAPEASGELVEVHRAWRENFVSESQGAGREKDEP